MKRWRELKDVPIASIMGTKCPPTPDWALEGRLIVLVWGPLLWNSSFFKAISFQYKGLFLFLLLFPNWKDL